jgi:hypothetical protein
MSSVYLLYSNYLDTEVIAASSVSSEATGNPVSNLYDKYKRYKTWRSAGYWEVASGSNTIVFRETVGVNLTATIAVANYTTDAIFLAAIKTALDAAGDSTYTVTRNSTSQKLVITSNGVGGGGIFQIYFSTGSAIAFGAAVGFDTSTSRTGALTYTADLVKIHSYEYLKWDFGTDSNPKAFVLTSARNQTLKISSSAQVILQGNETDAWTSPSYTQTLAYDVNTYFQFDSDGLHTSALRFWRLKIIDPSNINGYVEAATVYLGNAYAPDSGRAQFPFSTELVDLSDVIYSENGVAFTDRKPQTEKFNVTWKFVKKDEVAIFKTIFAKFGKFRPLFVAFDPDAAFSNSSNSYVRWVRFESEPNFNLETATFWGSRMELREEI